jgi:hypothetical protein
MNLVGQYRPLNLPHEGAPYEGFQSEILNLEILNYASFTEAQNTKTREELECLPFANLISRSKPLQFILMGRSLFLCPKVRLTTSVTL